MVFSSAPFLFIFLPIVLILHTAVRKTKTRNVILTIASLLFYAYGEPAFVFVMLIFAALNRFAVLRMKEDEQAKGLWFTLALGLDIFLLVIFKFLGSLSGMLFGSYASLVRMPEMAVPIGLSFFTLRLISYLTDVYRDTEKAVKDPMDLLLYLSFFPVMTAGPLMSHEEFSGQYKDRSVGVSDIAGGIQRFTYGLFKKVIIADTACRVADGLFALDPSELSMAAAWMAALAFALQIVFDLSGYADMAVGIGKMLGFGIPENFDHPYGSFSMREFLGRWNITLVEWFRKYVFEPLMGGSKSQGRSAICKLVVFGLAGVLHGFGLKYLMFGLLIGIVLIAEDEFEIRYRLRRYKWAGWIYTMLAVIAALVMLRADTFGRGIAVLGKMIAGGAGTVTAHNELMRVLDPYSVSVIVLGCVMSVISIERLVPGRIRTGLDKQSPAARVLSIAVLLLCLLAVAGRVTVPSVYFRF